MSTYLREEHIIPQETSYTFVFKDEKIYIENGDRSLAFDSFFELEELKIIIDLVIQKGINYGFLYENKESNT